MRLFDIEISERPDGAVVALSGEIDMSTIEELESRLRTTLEHSPDTLVLDLTGVTFLDSSGLRFVLRLNKTQRDREARLVVVPGGRRVSRVFELTGANEELELAEGEPLDHS